MEVVEDMRGHVLSDGGLSETQVSLKFVFPLLEGTAKRGQSIVDAFVDVLFSRLEMEESVSEPAQRIAPFQCSLIVFDFKACIERFLVVQFKTVVFPEGRAPSHFGRKAAYSVFVEGLIEASIQPTLLHRFNVQAWYEILRIPYFFPPLLHDQMMQLMLLLPDGQLILILRLYNIPQIFLLLLQFQLQQFLSPLVMLLKITQLLFALCPEVHSDTLIKLRLGHLIQPLLQPIHSLLKGNPFQPFHLFSCIDLHLLKMLIIIQRLDKMMVHYHNYKITSFSYQFVSIVYSAIKSSMEDSNIKINQMKNFDAVESPRVQGERDTVERLLEKRGTARNGTEGVRRRNEVWEDGEGGITSEKYCYPAFLSWLGNCCIPCKICCPFLFCPCCPCKANPLFQQPMQNLGLLQQWGHFEKILTPGLHVINPISQSVIEVNQQTKMLEYSQIGISRDNVQFDLSVVIFYRVSDSLKLAYKLGSLDIVNCMTQIATGTLRSVLGENPLQEIIQNRSLITHRFTDQLNKQVAFWGLYVEVCSLKEIKIDKDVQTSLQAVAKTKREVEAMLIDYRAQIQCGKLIKQISSIINNEASFQIRYLNMVQGILANTKQENLIFLSTSLKQ